MIEGVVSATPSAKYLNRKGEIMRSFTKISRRLVAYFTALVLVAGYPLSAMAETQEATTPIVDTVQTTETPTPTPAPVQTPAPAAETPAPVKEKKEPAYTYNPETQTWDSKQWKFNPETGKYERPVAPTIISPTTENTPQSELDKNVDTTVNINNNVTSDATSGNSAVQNNTTGGNATTGDAAAMATLLNVVNSSVNTGDNQKVASFTQDIMGDVKGDIILYPMLLKAMLEAQAPAYTGATIDATSNLNINNNVELNATSGNATVSGNTTAGDATTGSAKSVANVVNILNSMIATQQSFIGTVNIYGNLEGDILVAPDFIPQMLANNKQADGSDTQLSNESTTNIVNNISTVAESGAAAVFGNTTGGNATTGSADTGVVIFNLTGHQIVAKNSLLVFVNVLGKWVGVIVDAPEGATAALIGTDVTTNEYAPDLLVNSESNHGITNTIAVNAQSGDATVSGNTTAGNAVTGSAQALANVANVSNSQIGATDWFGVLFINVFQDWHGSFGIDTFYGNDTSEPAKEEPTGPVQFVPQQEATLKQSSSSTITSNRSFVSNTSNVQSTTTENIETQATIADETSTEATLGATTEAEPKESTMLDTGVDYRIFIVAGSILLAGASVIGLRRILS